MAQCTAGPLKSCSALPLLPTPNPPGSVLLPFSPSPLLPSEPLPAHSGRGGSLCVPEAPIGTVLFSDPAPRLFPLSTLRAHPGSPPPACRLPGVILSLTVCVRVLMPLPLSPTWISTVSLRYRLIVTQASSCCSVFGCRPSLA